MSLNLRFRPIRFAPVLAAALVVSAGAAAAQDAAQTRAASAPSAQEILKKAEKAMGAEAAAKHDSMKIQQAMSVPQQGMTMDLTVYTQGSDRILTVMNLAGMAEFRMGYDGETGWSVDPMMGPRVLTEEEVAQLRERPEAGGSLLSLYPTASVLGEEEFAGRPAWKLALTSASGNESTAWFDKDSYFMIGMAGTQKNMMGEIPYTAELGDYQEHHGMMLPGSTTVKAAGTEQQVTLKSVEVNLQELPSFGPPPEVQAVMKSSE